MPRWSSPCRSPSPPRNRPAGTRRRLDGTVLRRSPGHQPDRPDGDRHRSRLRDGAAVDLPIAIPPRRRHLPVNLLPGSPPARRRRWSTRARAASRSSSSGRFTGTAGAAGTTPAASAPQTTRVLGEGATGNFFSTFILLVNPNPTAVSVTVRLLSDDARRSTSSHRRREQPPDDPGHNLPRFRSANFATSSPPRSRSSSSALYWLGFEGGHDATAVPPVDVALRGGLHGGTSRPTSCSPTPPEVDLGAELLPDTGPSSPRPSRSPNSRRTPRSRLPECWAAFATTIGQRADRRRASDFTGQLRRGPRDRRP